MHNSAILSDSFFMPHYACYCRHKRLARLFLPKIFMKICNLSGIYYAFNPLYKLRLFDVHWQTLHNLLQVWIELRTLHTVVTSKCACIRPLYLLLIWRYRPWKSEMDVQRRWLCVLAVSRSDVRHYVDISVFQVILGSKVQNKGNLYLLNFRAQHASKYVYKLNKFLSNSYLHTSCL